MTGGDRSRVAALPYVSRETLARFEALLALLTKWNARINLVGPNTIGEAWERHILDSAQVFPLLPPGMRTLVDLGTGAGFPGLVLAILGVPDVHLVESDARKCAFLTEAARVVGAPVRIHLSRIESAPVIAADIVTARALKPLSALLDYAEPFLRPGSSCYFHKGGLWAAELAEARRSWHLTATSHPSLVDSAGVILQLEDVARDRQR